MKYLITAIFFIISLTANAQYNRLRRHIVSGKKVGQPSRGIASVREESNIKVKKKGNTYHYSNGSSTTKIGNTYYNSNGTYCHYTETSVFCNY